MITPRTAEGAGGPTCPCCAGTVDTYCYCPSWCDEVCDNVDAHGEPPEELQDRDAAIRAEATRAEHARIVHLLVIEGFYRGAELLEREGPGGKR